MKFLIYSINYEPELTGIGKYNGELASALNGRGVSVYVVTAVPYYPEWRRHEGYCNRWSKAENGKTVIYRCPLYVPTKVTTLRRLLHLVSFAFTSGLRLLTLLRLKPDVLFLVQPTLFCAPVALLYSKLTGAKVVLHIQDFEVDAMFGLDMTSFGGGTSRSKSQGVFRRLVRRCESWLMNRFDQVSSISYSMLDNAKNKGVERNKLLFFPNWSDTDFVTPEVDGSQLRCRWGYNSDEKIVLYSGNVGNKQGLEVVLDAAKVLSSSVEVKFLIIGNGAYGKKLQQLAVKMELTNLAFKSLQPWEDVPQILAMADIHLVVQKRGAADAVLPSKLTNILSAGGHALVTAEPDTELGKISTMWPGIYVLVDPENTEDFIDALKKYLEKDTTKSNMVARKYACEFLNKDKVIDQFIADMYELLGSKQNKVMDYECDI